MSKNTKDTKDTEDTEDTEDMQDTDPENLQPDAPQTSAAAAPSEPTPDASGELDLQPGDTYLEGPYVVFTAQYHLRRGYCCNSDCRHCPYG